MRTYQLPTIVIGAILGFISREYSGVNSHLMIISLSIILLTQLYRIVNKHDLWLRALSLKILILCLSFIVANIYYNIVAIKQNTVSNSSRQIVDGIIYIDKIENKNSYTNVYATLEESTSDLTYNVLIQSFSQNTYKLNSKYNINGELKFESIILPNRKNELSNVGQKIRSFDLLKTSKYESVDAVLRVSESEEISTNREKDTGNILSLINLGVTNTRISTRSFISENLTPRTGGVLLAMTLGDEEGLSDDIKNSFLKASVSHLLVLSGQNVAIFFTMILLLSASLSKSKKVILLIGALLLYAISIEMAHPIIRALLIVAYVIIGSVLTKRISPKHGLWLALLVILITNPKWITMSISLQLSALAATSIIYFVPYIKSYLDTKINKILATPIALVLGVNILIAPYLMFQFGYYNMMSVIANILITPIASLLLIFGTAWLLLAYMTNSITNLLNINFEILLIPVIKILAVSTELLTNTLLGFVNFFSINTINIIFQFSFTILIIYYIIIVIVYHAYKEYLKHNN